MIAVLLCLAATALVFGAARSLLAAGLRAGDRPGDTSLMAVEPDGEGDGIWLTVHNAGQTVVLIGASIRRRSMRLWCEAGSFVTVPRRTSQEKLRAGQHGIIYALAAGEMHTVLVRSTAAIGQRAELVLAVGETDRLRVIHRAVELPRPRQAGQYEPTAKSRRRARRALTVPYWAETHPITPPPTSGDSARSPLRSPGRFRRGEWPARRWRPIAAGLEAWSEMSRLRPLRRLKFGLRLSVRRH